MSVLIDAGPLLSFMAASHQSVLVELAERSGLELATCQTVDDEIVRKAADRRFARTPAGSTWGKLRRGRVRVLSDEIADSRFPAAISRISDVNATQRRRDRRSLGEIMVIAHASLLVQDGTEVYVLMDDGDARQRALRERAWLKQQGYAASLYLWGSQEVLRQAHALDVIDDWAAAYNQVRAFDDALGPLA